MSPRRAGEVTTSRDAGEVITTREAVETDISGIREVFHSIYGDDYPHPVFYDEWWLKRSIYSDDVLMFVALDAAGEVLGTASVVLDVGAHSDLVGEFGRLAVHEQARGRGAGRALMRARLAAVRDRIHVGIVENRTVHAWSQRISLGHGFSPVGFLPMKHLFHYRESVAMYGQHFDHAVGMRRNHPRLVPEVAPLASLAMQAAGLAFDGIVDEASAPYPQDGGFRFEELGARSLPALLRIERGRVSYRDLFGPLRLQYGFFRLAAHRATYLLARDRHDNVAGAIGFIRDPHARGLRIFELISVGDRVVRPLLEELLRRCGQEWSVEYVEADVSGFAPRMQRTLSELGFVAAAYIPAMVFHSVERLDVVKMVQVRVPVSLGPLELALESRPFADLVVGALTRRQVLPRISEAMGAIRAFDGLSEEQRTRVASVCRLHERGDGAELWRAGDPSESAWLLLQGAVAVERTDPAGEVGRVRAGEVVGEVALLTGEVHSATVRALGPVVAAVLSRQDMVDLERQRPDIAVVLYKNLARGLGRKLRGTGEAQR